MIISRQLVRGRALTSKGRNPRKYITVHETGNNSKGADAQAHARLQASGNARSASWHWQVDDVRAIQSFPHTVKCWHASDGMGPGNQKSIAVEICVNADGNFAKARANAAVLVAQIMAEEKIPLANVVTHHHWSGKNCPTNILAAGWSNFRAQVKTSVVEARPVKKKPKAKPKAKASKVYLVQGSKGRRVKKLQRALNKVFPAYRHQSRVLAGHFLATDSHYGPHTAAWVRLFQVATGLTRDGLAGPDTQAELRKYGINL